MRRFQWTLLRLSLLSGQMKLAVCALFLEWGAAYVRGVAMIFHLNQAIPKMDPVLKAISVAAALFLAIGYAWQTIATEGVLKEVGFYSGQKFIRHGAGIASATLGTILVISTLAASLALSQVFFFAIANSVALTMFARGREFSRERWARFLAALQDHHLDHIKGKAYYYYFTKLTQTAWALLVFVFCEGLSVCLFGRHSLIEGIKAAAAIGGMALIVLPPCYYFFCIQPAIAVSREVDEAEASSHKDA